MCLICVVLGRSDGTHFTVYVMVHCNEPFSSCAGLFSCQLNCICNTFFCLFVSCWGVFWFLNTALVFAVSASIVIHFCHSVVCPYNFALKNDSLCLTLLESACTQIILWLYFISIQKPVAFWNRLASCFSISSAWLLYLPG